MAHRIPHKMSRSRAQIADRSVNNVTERQSDFYLVTDCELLFGVELLRRGDCDVGQASLVSDQWLHCHD